MKREIYPSKQTVNLAVCGRAPERSGLVLPLFFICLILLGMIIGASILWPLKRLENLRTDIRRKKEELARYQEYNEDYYQVEERYGQYFCTYLTEGEADIIERGPAVKLMEEMTAAYGGTKSLEIQDNTCRVVIEAMPLSGLSSLMQELEASPLTRQVTVAVTAAREDETDEGGGQTVTADLTAVLVEAEEY